MPIHTVPGGTIAGSGLVQLAGRCTGATSVPAALRAHLNSSAERKRGNFSSFIENKGNFSSFIEPGV